MSLVPPDTDPRFAVIGAELASFADRLSDPPPFEGESPQAAVALVLRATSDLHVLLIKRARSERDPWSGQMALPGGRRDAADSTLLATAMREALEEVGLDLDRGAHQLGGLSVVAPRSPRLSSLSITPFVFGVGADAHAYVASHEVADVVWVALDELRSPETHSTVRIPFGGETREFACYRVAGEVVWGLTYGILAQFLEIYAEVNLPPPTPR
ncbi:MAG: CoA pyrophosphatase [Gemmatimonadota bacterium]|nr:CoA pyrophosphatase [Gemmatimonadota bacterium]